MIFTRWSSAESTGTYFAGLTLHYCYRIKNTGQHVYYQRSSLSESFEYFWLQLSKLKRRRRRRTTTGATTIATTNVI